MRIIITWPVSEELIWQTKTKIVICGELRSKTKQVKPSCTMNNNVAATNGLDRQPAGLTQSGPGGEISA